MAAMRILVTGATGLVGSHVTEEAIHRGHAVTALVRNDSKTALLERRGARISRGELTDPQAVAQAVAGMDAVVHCAAKVGDWGPVGEYRKVNVEGLRTLLEAARSQPLRRFIHLSSLGVYEARDHFGTDETVPPPRKHIDGYTQSKVEAEDLALQYHRQHGVPVTILRPGFVYGPRDRTVLPKLLQSLREKQLKYLGSGQQSMNAIGVHNLVDAIFLAMENDAAVGQIYNLTDDEPVSKRRFIETIAACAGLEPPSSSVPLWIAKVLAKVMEGFARTFGAKQPPLLTQARIKFLGLHLGFSVAKAKRELGYRPRVPFTEGIREAVAWATGHPGTAPEEESEPVSQETA